MEKEMQELLSLVKEGVNLRNLYQEKLAVVSQMAAGGNYTSWDLRSKVPGWSPTDPLDRWRGKVVKVKGMEAFGEATVIATKRVGDFHLPGVMFHVPVTDGHSLSQLTSGRRGMDGFCLWTWIDQLTVVNP